MTPVWRHDPSTSSSGSFPGGWWDEEWFGLNGVSVNDRDAQNPDPGKPDMLEPRAAVTMLTGLRNL
jgi:hypothetical protein